MAVPSLKLKRWTVSRRYSEEVAIRTAALRYGFEHNKDMALPQHTMTVLESDLGQEEIIRSLSKYEIISGPIDARRLDAAALRKQVSIVWSVKVVARSADEAQVEVGCQYHMTKGYGVRMILKRGDGVWKVIDSDLIRMS